MADGFPELVVASNTYSYWLWSAKYPELRPWKVSDLYCVLVVIYKCAFSDKAHLVEIKFFLWPCISSFKITYITYITRCQVPSSLDFHTRWCLAISFWFGPLCSWFPLATKMGHSSRIARIWYGRNCSLCVLGL